MSANTTPLFTLTPFATATQIATANTNRDGTGTIGTIKAAGTYGSRIDRVVLTAAVATTAGVVRLYISDGTNHRLLEEILVTAITPSASVAVWSGESQVITPESPLVIPDTYSLRASTHNAEAINVCAMGGDY